MSASTPFSDELPEAVLPYILDFLTAPDILQLLCCNKALARLNRSEILWKYLLGCDENDWLVSTTETATTTAEARRLYLQRAYTQLLPQVQWNAVVRTPQVPSGREGHVGCVLGGANEEWLVVTGGFTQDPIVYMKNTLDETDWYRIRPSGTQLRMTYGASLTRLDETTAIQFGGFQAGGYSGETHQVALLTVNLSTRAAYWAPQETNLGSVVPARLARAYHTATLMQGRYLLVMGGMQSSSSILYPVILDTHTWNWYEVSTCADDQEPSARHGHSLIYDEKKKRFVLFGGGSGSDLLRSGQDNAQVWELSLPDAWEADILKSFPWRWSLLHDEPAEHLQQAEGHEDEPDASNEVGRIQLSPAETLILGRCHMAHLVSPAMVLLLMGSGRPSTNGVIAYNLRTDSFERPIIRGPLPTPRFTAVSLHLKRQGYIVVHGGFSAQHETSVIDMCLIDLAPALLPRRCGFEIDNNVPSNAAVTDEDSLSHRNVDHNYMEQIMFGLLEVDDNERPLRAAQMLATNQFAGRASLLLSLISAGGLRFERGDADGQEENESDSDYEDESDDMSE
jgi:hypothetical protein